MTDLQYHIINWYMFLYGLNRSLTFKLAYPGKYIVFIG